MPRYYFNLLSGDIVFEDQEGVVCEDAEAARALALRTLGSIVAESTLKADIQAFGIHVRDEAGILVYSSTISQQGGSAV